jgi:site-specific DNA-methyltransferase (cytosine-N4-specific)
MGLITTKKAAELLGITAVRVRQLIAAGLLKSEKAGRDHLLEESEVVRFDREARRPRGRPHKGNGKSIACAIAFPKLAAICEKAAQMIF